MKRGHSGSLAPWLPLPLRLGGTLASLTLDPSERKYLTASYLTVCGAWEAPSCLSDSRPHLASPRLLVGCPRSSLTREGRKGCYIALGSPNVLSIKSECPSLLTRLLGHISQLVLILEERKIFVKPLKVYQGHGWKKISLDFWT